MSHSNKKKKIYSTFSQFKFKFDEQVDKLIEYLKLDEEHLKLRTSICDSLSKILTNYWSENGKITK